MTTQMDSGSVGAFRSLPPSVVAGEVAREVVSYESRPRSCIKYVIAREKTSLRYSESSHRRLDCDLFAHKSELRCVERHQSLFRATTKRHQELTCAASFSRFW
ncbi:uncharacterized protein LOC111269533 isoform X2 [Varroa jacobsoni]|uniref:uncharacterized protein LOC111269533 isoform X2 n=1 Tax=Varroa jacobsoni TaxID=62625 RepID=UPI000BF9DE05|nr:uncharacterized protein LOC111269533 isoform X2 [Varroa jacobsoni]